MAKRAHGAGHGSCNRSHGGATGPRVTMTTGSDDGKWQEGNRIVFSIDNINA